MDIYIDICISPPSVTKGMEVVKAIEAVGSQSGKTAKPFVTLGGEMHMSMYMSMYMSMCYVSPCPW
jgi:hypothetical protein